MYFANVLGILGGIFNKLLFYSIGEGRLREVFLKTDNDFGGTYFAHLIKVLNMHTKSMYQP